MPIMTRMHAGAAVSVTRNIFVRGVPAGLKMWLLSSRGGFGDWAKFPNELLCIIELFFGTTNDTPVDTKQM
jgi:hypothetical protein